MKINIIKKFLMLFALSAIIFSCDENEQTGFSVTSPSSPSLAIDLDFTNPTLIEDDSEYTYTVTLSETQVVDVKLHVVQIGGTANSDDYEMTDLISIPAGYTSASGSIKILADDLIEDTETLQIQVGTETTSNAALTPVTTEFTILNYTDGDLVVDLAWDMSIVTDDAGEEISATDFADLRLLVSSTPDNAGDIAQADGGSFETLVLDASTADGTYYIVADFYAANETIFRDLDLTMEINQAGTINGMTYEYAAALNNSTQCSAAYFVLAELVKTGDSYTITSIGESQPLLDAEGEWYFFLYDSYGDGWDGAYITVTLNGVSTDYSPTADILEEYIQVPAGAEFSISYTSGDYEGEHNLGVVQPDGTVLSWGTAFDGVNIPEGTLYDSTNVCP